MKFLIFPFFLLLSLSGFSQTYQVDTTKIREDLEEILTDISQNYAYLKGKNTDLDCIKSSYGNKIKDIQSEEETVLFFEYLLDEFYDSHVMLSTNRKSSFRLHSPIYSTFVGESAMISYVWQTQIEPIEQAILGAEIQKLNGVDFAKAIEQFPTSCQDKSKQKTKEWIANKLLAGRYNQPRVLTLKLADESVIDFDLDQIQLKKNEALLSARTENGVGVIRVNNSLGNNQLIGEFDKALKGLMNTKGLVIDLRNTVDGGNSYVARGIMSRFISTRKPYQEHRKLEKYSRQAFVERSWLEYVSPRGEIYTKPVAILVGRWTGSMGEGTAIGFEGMGRASVFGSEMERLAGEMSGFSFRHQKYGYRLSIAKLFHVNGMPREKYIPENYVRQSDLEKDEVLEAGMNWLNQQGVSEAMQSKDSLLKKQLKQIAIEDQTLRFLLPDAIEKFGNGSEETNYVWSLIHRQDSICEYKIGQIVNEYGWLGKSKVGDEANQAIWLIVQHAELPTQEKFLPLLESSVAKGESEGWHLAFLQDRILMRKNEKQIYGTQSLWDKTINKNRIYPIRDRKNVNKLRKELGLESIEEYAKTNGHVLD